MRAAIRLTSHVAQIFCCIAFVASAMAAQQRSTAPAQTPLSQELPRLGVEALALNQSLPSFTCEEAATSEAIRGGKVVRSVPLSGVLRVVRKPDGSLHETYDYKRPRILLFIPSTIPIFVRGGFDSALNYFLPGAQACYSYSLSERRINFEARTGAPAGCQEHGLKGFATVNANGDIDHIERTVPEEVAKPLKIVPFASVDLSPVELNGRVYQLSHHIIAEMPLGGATGHFEATYSGCHLYQATVTLGASTEVSPGGAPKP